MRAGAHGDASRSHERAGPLVRGMSWLVAVSPLPSAAWRLNLLMGAHEGTGVPIGRIREDPSGIVVLTVLSLGVTLLALALPRPLSRRVPPWSPALGGRAIPAVLAVAPAAAASAVLITAEIYAGLNGLFHWVGPLNSTGETLVLSEQELWLGRLCYAPLLLTGPLLAWLTVDHVRRRRRSAGQAGGEVRARLSAR